MRPVERQRDVPKLASFARTGLVVVLGLYPVLVYFGLAYFSVVAVAVLLFAVCFLRLVIGLNFPTAGQSAGAMALINVAGMVLALLALMQRSASFVLLYPVLINAGLFAAFGLSLRFPPSAIERIARYWEGDLPQEAVAYTRKLTVVWAVFFAVNGLVALYTALFASLEVWTLYNGLLSYVIIAVLVIGERLFRAVASGNRH